MHNDVDLVKLGPRNLDFTRYGLKIARLLWSDEELKNGRLFPKGANGTQQPLSPIRSEKFKKSLKGRFHAIDEEDLQPAIEL